MNEPSHSDSPTPDKPPADVASFVLRFSQDLWREAGGQPRVRWRGHIRHVQGDAETRFTDFSDAVAFMQRQLAQLTLESVAQDDAQGQAQALSESYQVWEKVTEGYRDVWLGAIRTAMDGTQAMRRQVGQQMERALPWWPFWPGTPAPANPSVAGDASASPAAGQMEGQSDATAGWSPNAFEDLGAATPSLLLDALAAIQTQLATLSQQLEALERSRVDGA